MVNQKLIVQFSCRLGPLANESQVGTTGKKKRKEESTEQHTGACRLVNNQPGLICGKQNEDTLGVSEGEKKVKIN